MDAAQLGLIKQWLQTGSINIFGLPFSGKDTHGHELKKLLDAVLISGGDILRSPIGPQHIKDHIGQGNLAPTDEFLSIVLPYLAQSTFKSKPLILSSVGRWHGEEASIYEAAQEAGHPIKAVIYLSITEEEAKRRWQLAKRDRQDDTSEAVLETRFNEFRKKTLPVIAYYQERGLVLEVDGMPPRAVVTEDILHQLAARVQAEQ